MKHLLPPQPLKGKRREASEDPYFSGVCVRVCVCVCVLCVCVCDDVDEPRTEGERAGREAAETTSGDMRVRGRCGRAVNSMGKRIFAGEP
jgi:hypothetical protein